MPTHARAAPHHVNAPGRVTAALHHVNAPVHDGAAWGRVRALPRSAMLARPRVRDHANMAGMCMQNRATSTLPAIPTGTFPLRRGFSTAPKTWSWDAARGRQAAPAAETHPGREGPSGLEWLAGQIFRGG